MIEFARDPSALARAFEKEKDRTESEFERLVLQLLIADGYNVTSQWKVGSHRIDLVVSGGGKRLAVECDGDRWHPLDKLMEDMARQAILERLGWKFVRIRGCEFFRNPHSAMQPIFDKLSSLGIPPELSGVETARSDCVDDELKQRVIRRAEEIRQSWIENDVSSRPQESSSVTSDQRRSDNGTSDDSTPPDNSQRDRDRGYSTGDLFRELPTENQKRLELGAADSQRPIEQVSLLEIRGALESLLSNDTAIDRIELLTILSKKLGYRRMGRKIRSRLNKTIYREIREGRLEIDAHGKVMRTSVTSG